MMARPKRKRNSKIIVNEISEDDSSDNPHWEAKAILQERTRRGRLEYLIDWEGTNEKTGKPYEPTWEPAKQANCTKALLADWEETKRETAQASNAAEDGASSRLGHNRKRAQNRKPVDPSPRPAKRPRVIESSAPSASSTTHPSSTHVPAQAHSDTGDGIRGEPGLQRKRAQSPKLLHPSPRWSKKSRIIHVSQPSSNPATPTSLSPILGQPTSPQDCEANGSAGPARLSPEVRIPPRADHDSFDYYSQLPPTQNPTEGTHRSFLNSSQTSHNRSWGFRSSGVVNDSEDEDASDSYVPVTQDSLSTAAAQQQSSFLNSDIIASTLLEGRPTGTSGVWISEPQSDHDTIEDSQAEVQALVGFQESDGGEIPDRFETAASALQAPLEEVQEPADPSTSATENSNAVQNPAGESNAQTTVLDSAPGAFQTTFQADLQASDGSIEQLNPVSSPDRVAAPTSNGSEWHVEDTEDPSPLDRREPVIELAVPGAQPDNYHTSEENAASSNPGEVRSSHALSAEIREDREHAVQAAAVETTNNASPSADSRLENEASPSGLVVPSPQPPPSNNKGNDNQATAPVSAVETTNHVSVPIGTPLENAVTACEYIENVVERSTEYHDFAATSQSNAGHSTANPERAVQQQAAETAAFEQHAQVVLRNDYTSSEEDASESIRPTIEKEGDLEQAGSPGSRHDSSQESPSPSTKSSLARQTPSQELASPLASGVPSHPRTPGEALLTASMDIRAPISKEELEEARRQRLRDNPRKSVMAELTPLKFSTPGTRSPSTIPDRSPLPQVQQSLRSVAITNSATAAEAASGNGDSENHLAPLVPNDPASADDDLDDDDDDDDDLFIDDLDLGPDEYIIPLPIAGRQAEMYKDEFRNVTKILKDFLEDPLGFEDIASIENLLGRFRAIETHVDLILRDSLTAQGIDPATPLEFQAQWSSENSIKFKFVGTLLQKLQGHNMNVILLIDGRDKRLFGLLETFLRAKRISFTSPTGAHQAATVQPEGSLKVTLLSSDSIATVQLPAELIICLDGCLDVQQIRTQTWAKRPDRLHVPVLHLVIPRTIDHIHRYVSSSLEPRSRLHTIFASLAQFYQLGGIGQARAPQTLAPHEAAEAVVEFINARRENNWAQKLKVHPIDGIKDLVDCSPQSQSMVATPPPDSAASAKRPLVGSVDSHEPAERSNIVFTGGRGF